MKLNRVYVWRPAETCWENTWTNDPVLRLIGIPLKIDYAGYDRFNWSFHVFLAAARILEEAKSCH